MKTREKMIEDIEGILNPYLNLFKHSHFKRELANKILAYFEELLESIVGKKSILDKFTRSKFLK